jgi:predicted Rossmann-fold nucleotide-binding protein
VSDQGGAVKTERAALRAVCVFCGSNPGSSLPHRQAAEKLGAAIAQAGLRLIYGAGDKGLMGITARAALANRGFVTGVIPAFLTESSVKNVSERGTMRGLALSGCDRGSTTRRAKALRTSAGAG